MIDALLHCAGCKPFGGLWFFLGTRGVIDVSSFLTPPFNSPYRAATTCPHLSDPCAIPRLWKVGLLKVEFAHLSILNVLFLCLFGSLAHCWFNRCRGNSGPPPFAGISRVLGTVG
eukprot:502076-Amphidinium_carterae.1